MYVQMSVFRYVLVSTDAGGGQIRSWTPGAASHSVWMLGTKLRSSAGAVHSTHLTPELPLLPLIVAPVCTLSLFLTWHFVGSSYRNSVDSTNRNWPPSWLSSRWKWLNERSASSR